MDIPRGGRPRLLLAIALWILPLGAHPALDRDGDGLSDEDEIHQYLSSPTNRSTAGNGVPDGDWAQRRQFTTTIRAVLRVLKPCMAGTHHDPFQDSAVLADYGQTVDLECIAYLHRQGMEGARLPDLRLKRRERRIFSRLPENTEWHQDNAAFAEWLAPTRACNWNEGLRQQIIQELGLDGIAVEALTDLDLVEWVVEWLWEKSECRTTAGLPYLFSFQKNRLSLPSATYTFFVRNNPLPWPEWKSPFEPEWKAYADLAFDGRKMWQAHRYDWGMGWCVYVATVLRALGIPTRFAQFVPLVNPARAPELEYLERVMKPAPLRDFLLQNSRGPYALDMLQDHWQVVTMNEVRVGERWVLLHLPRSGTGVHFPATPMEAAVTPGYLLRIHTFADPTTLDYASTWGRKAAGTLRVPSIPGAAPWQLLSITPSVGRYSRLIINEQTNREDLDPPGEAAPSAYQAPAAAADGASPRVAGEDDRMPLIHRLPLEREALAQVRREGLRAGEFPTAFPVPKSYSSLLHFQVDPSQFPNRKLPGSPEATPPKAKAGARGLPYDFFPAEAPGTVPPGPSNLARDLTNPGSWSILDAFWYDSEKRPLPMPPALATGGATLILIKVRRPDGNPPESFLGRCNRRFRLEREGEPPIPVRLLPVYWEDYFALSIPMTEFPKMKSGITYRLAQEPVGEAIPWRLVEGLVLQRP